ncbi:MAG: response regulator [Candidatus Accumulibacter sp.]|nr:response regulator [Accumulibacter sp.]
MTTSPAPPLQPPEHDAVIDLAVCHHCRREEYMDLLFANVPENILIFDGAGRLTRCSNYFLRQIEAERFGNVVGWHFTRLYLLFGNDAFVDSAVKRFEHVKAGRKTVTTDMHLTFPALREERLYTLHSAPMLAEGGRLDGVIVVLHDSTEHSRAEADERTRAMLNATPLACSFWDENLNVIDCNQGCATLFGLSSREEYIQRFNELSPEFQPNGDNSREAALRYNREVYASGERRRFEWVHWVPDTRRRLLTEVTLVRVRWKNDYRVVNFVRDISEIEESEAKRREAEAHSRELEVQTRAAKVASDAKSQFLANMSHEIRTPMNAIIGMSELIRTDNLDATQKDFVADIRKMSHALLHIINGILDFSKIESGKLELNPVHFDLLEIYDNICSINRFAAESKNLSFTASLAPDVPHILYGDDVRMRQVITNILGNAIKYTRQGGVDFKIARVEKDDETWLSFTVDDTGIGIRQEDFPRLFDSFAQLDRQANRDQIGTGLGLPITQSLVKLMQGRIDFQSEYGKGSRFTILLPLTPGDPAQIDKAPQSALHFHAAAANVLVVDDNQINLKVALAYLVTYGIHADTALDGREALAKVERNDYDLVFMDQMMPEMDGLETTQKIRALGQTPGGEKYRNLAIVALTANAVRGAEQIFLAAGMNGFISKPINPDELNRVLMTWLPPEKIVATAAANLAAAATVAETAAPTVIDHELGLKNVTGDSRLYRQLLTDFTHGHADDAARLREQLAKGDFTSAHRLAHTLKSTAATLGATALSRAAAALEDILRDKREDAAALVEVEHQLTAVMTTLDTVSSTSAFEEAAPAIADKFTPAAALALADELEPLLASGDTSVLDRVTDIHRQYSRFGEYCGLLVKQIEDFDFDCARQTLVSIRGRLKNE